MTLHARLARGAAKFELTDEEAETVVTITEQDDQGSIIRKMRRIIALVEGEQADPQGMFAPGGRWQGEEPTPQLRYVDAAPVQTGNGWAALAPPTIPEGADYERIPPEEQG